MIIISQKTARVSNPDVQGAILMEDKPAENPLD